MAPSAGGSGKFTLQLTAPDGAMLTTAMDVKRKFGMVMKEASDVRAESKALMTSPSPAAAAASVGSAEALAAAAATASAAAAAAALPGAENEVLEVIPTAMAVAVDESVEEIDDTPGRVGTPTAVADPDAVVADID